MIIRDYYDQLYTNKMDNRDKMDKFLEIHPLRLNHDEIENLNRLSSITSNKIESVIKNLPPPPHTKKFRTRQLYRLILPNI